MVRRDDPGPPGTSAESEVMQAFARHAATDPDPEVAIFALDRYRYERMLEIRQS